MIKLNVACGKDIREDYVNIDKIDCGQEIIRDITKGLPFSDNSVDEILFKHAMEHLEFEEIVFVMNEFWRVLKKGGLLYVVCPHRKSPGAYTITHKSFIDETTFDFFRRERSEKLFGVKGLWEIKEMIVNKSREGAIKDIHVKLNPIK